MFKDVHIHCAENIKGADILASMDRIGMEKGILFSPMPGYTDLAPQEAIGVLAQACSEDPERMIGFATIDPSQPGAADLVDMAVNEKGLQGFKMLPDHWYPYEERLFPVYKKIEEFRKPILFHSGILYAYGDSSRFCRPCFFEVMLHFPKIKFALAHISWPWTDECIATYGRMRSFAKGPEKCQMYIDTTRGTPPFYRKDALDKAIKFAGSGKILYGSDDHLPSDLSKTRRDVDADHAIIVDELGYSEDDYSKITSSNFEEFLHPFENQGKDTNDI
jgi:predicted TIM-barrel fold metal-dependent hydrolase